MGVPFQGNGNGKKGAVHEPPLQPLRKLAIVGSHPATRELAPYDDPAFEIWLFNEAAQKPEIYKRWDGLFQMHKPEVYTSLKNWVNKEHWNWLQQDYGDRRIFMQDVDARVPNSVRYPMEEVLRLTPYRYIRSTPAMALALAIVLGYQDVSLYGAELTSNTEYHYQAINLAFWIGLAHGRGVDFHLNCWQSEFDQPIYGVDGEMQISRDYFERRVDDVEKMWKINEGAVRRAQKRLDDAIFANEFNKAGELSLDLENTALAAGEAYGVLSEAKRYLEKTDPISRQEFERVSAQAQKDGDNLEKTMNHAGGKAEYVWNLWRLSGRADARDQFRQFVHEKTEAAFNTGMKLGTFRENATYMSEYDERVTALGGMRAVRQVDLTPDPFPKREGEKEGVV